MPAAAQHKDTLIQTAMRLFRRQGYASTGLQQILLESGAPKGSLYYYFPGGKEELAEAAVRLAGRLIAEMLRDTADRSATPADFVRMYCAKMAQWMEESHFRSGSPITTVMLETAPMIPSLTQAGAEVYASWEHIIAEVFVRAGMDGAKAQAWAQTLIATVEGALVLARIQQSAAPIRNIGASLDSAV